MNNDCKLFVTILAEILEIIIQDFNHENQHSFLSKKDDYQKCFGCSGQLKIHNKKQAALKFLDTEKIYNLNFLI